MEPSETVAQTRCSSPEAVDLAVVQLRSSAASGQVLVSNCIRIGLAIDASMVNSLRCELQRGAVVAYRQTFSEILSSNHLSR